MTAAQLYGGKIVTAFTSARRRWSMRTSSFGQSCGLRPAVFRRSHLCIKGKNLSHEAVIRCRKPSTTVPYCQVAPDCSIDPCDVEQDALNLAGESSLEMDNRANKVSETTWQPPDQPHSSSDKSHASPGKSDSYSIKRELLMLSFPAMASQAIDPMAQLMETAYIGRLGSLPLAAAGVSISIFNIISKLFNIPLLSVATSFVAEDIAKSSSDNYGENSNGNAPGGDFKRKQLSSVSTALLLALGIGIIEALALLFGAGPFLSLMGVSPVRFAYASYSTRFLSLRALGAPAVVLSLALQGILRGFKDTKTPVFCLGVANLAAVFLFPLLINYCQMGITGAAFATVLSQYIGSFLMIWFLSNSVVLLPPKLGDLKFGVYLKSGGFLIGRTFAVLITMTIATSMAARQGPSAMAAHQICLQVWMAVSLLTDALAASGQALVATSLSSGDYSAVKELTNFVLKVGMITGVVLAVILGSTFGSLSNLFTKDAEVLQIGKAGTLFVSASQPFNSLAFIFDGLHYGVSDFPYAACSMMLVGVISSAVLLYAPSVYGLPGVWLGLTLFMGLRVAAGYLRILSKNGPWWFLHRDSQKLVGSNQH